MNEILYAGLAVLSVMSILLVWLTVDHIKLKRNYRALAKHLNNHNLDIVGLCSASVGVDNRLAETAELLKELTEKINDFEQREEEAKPYRAIIQKVRSGADAAELIQKFGISRDEAVLLIRLHGAR
ncbi:DUF2802 domain-containing protein [Methylotuvimicrobium sp. KM1]|uniref:DUF2802 domain-containing protein n=1 Tax=Methylotuvimicrobium sp. KM1 TaxID=3377707 RepID=UPI00384ACC0B